MLVGDVGDAAAGPQFVGDGRFEPAEDEVDCLVHGGNAAASSIVDLAEIGQRLSAPAQPRENAPISTLR
jgi:hypothetical protein